MSISVLEKKRQTFTDSRSSRPRHQREDDYPHIYKRIEVEYIVTGIGVKPEAVARAIELSEEKYCSVRACSDRRSRS